jgi:hypothetical protein
MSSTGLQLHDMTRVVQTCLLMDLLIWTAETRYRRDLGAAMAERSCYAYAQTEMRARPHY